MITPRFCRWLLAASLNFCILHSAFCIPDVDRTQPPKPGPEPKASFPDFKADVLPNGLKIFTVEDHREPTVNFRLLIKAGDAYDRGQPGLADTTASLLNRGTQKRTAEQFAQETDFIGASVEGSSETGRDHGQRGRADQGPA